MEYVQLGLGKNQSYYPLEKMVLTFDDNGTYQIQSDLVFEPPQFDKKTLHHIYNANNALLQKLKNKMEVKPSERLDLRNLPDTYLICYLNGFEEAKDQMEIARPLLKQYDDKLYASLKETLRILRKVRYS